MTKQQAKIKYLFYRTMFRVPKEMRRHVYHLAFVNLELAERQIDIIQCTELALISETLAFELFDHV